jgi:hypothetical protein
MRLLISIVGISAAFVLGRLIAGSFNNRRLHVAPSAADDENEEVELVTPANDSVVIEGEPEEIFQTARTLEYFNQFLFGVDEIQLNNPSSARLVVAQDGTEYNLDLEIIAEQPGEFFGLRVEHKGLLYGTCLVRFERTGRRALTQVSVQTRYKTVMPTEMMNDIKAVVAREVDTYLTHLKERCEAQSAVAPQQYGSATSE